MFFLEHESKVRLISLIKFAFSEINKVRNETYGLNLF